MSIDYSKYIDSTGTHYISNSGKDENSAYRGGQAGDQSGHEWELKAWYSRPWSVVLRYPDIKVGMKIAELGIAAALNDKIGYDQNQRTTYWTQLEKAGYDPSKITVACEEDCTAGVTANVKAAGYLLGIKPLQNLSMSIYSGTMRSEFVKAGFEALTTSKYINGYSCLMPGDILLYENHHAATNITWGLDVEKADEPINEATETDIQEFDHVEVTNGKYYIRVAPNKKAESITVAEPGDILDYLGVTENGWWSVMYRDMEGWISEKCGKLIATETTGEIDVVEHVKWVVIKSLFTYIRSAPGKSFDKLKKVKKGERLSYLGETVDKWIYVRCDDIDGWVMEKKVKEDE